VEQNNNTNIILTLSILTFGIHLVAMINGGYGIFRDELYYIACANHPDFGYVDHPPLSIWILSAWKFIFGDSLFSIRVLPALCSGVTIFFIGKLAEEFGGQKYAIILACVSSMLTPIFLGFFSVYNMNVFDMVLWSVVFLLIQKFSKNREKKYWILIGFFIGVGALNKISMLWLGAGIFAGLLLTPDRKILRTKEPWFALLLAILIFAPFIIWNFNHDFAHLEFIRNAASEKYASQNPITFLLGLFALMNPLALPLWLSGFWLLLSIKENRLNGIAVLCVLAILIINIHSKPEYFTSAMTVLIPAGAVHLESFFGKFSKWIKVSYILILTISGIIFLPFFLDILPVQTFIKYQSTLGISLSSNEGKKLEALHQFFADRFGWKNMALQVSKVYASLQESEKKNTLIYCRNYGEAGAIDYFGREYCLPPAISQHNSYWYWSKKHLNQNATIIVIGVSKDKLTGDFEEVNEAGTIYSTYAMPYENNIPVLICRKPKRPVDSIWNGKKMFI